MPSELVIGILGGMGPEATLDCFGKLINNTVAEKDQDHLRIIIINNPKVPDRTQAILENGLSPLPVLIQGVESLKKAGADFVIIPCVTAHYFLNDLVKHCELPVLSLLDAVSNYIVGINPKIYKIGILATSGTIKSGIVKDRLEAEGIHTVVCSNKYQQQVMTAIYDIKNKNAVRCQPEITSSLVDAAQHLINNGAQGIIAGCTEIPLALSQSDIPVPYFDTLLILARAAIRRAGLVPKDKKEKKDK